MSITIKRAHSVIEFCTDMGLAEQHDMAIIALSAAEKEQDRDPREVNTAVREAAENVKVIEDQMKESTVFFTLSALPRKQWAEFLESNPPREGDAADAKTGVNISKMDDAIIPSIIGVKDADGEPLKFDPKESWVSLADEMSNGQWERFALAVLNLNNGDKTKAPFSQAALRAMRRSEQTSKRRSN